MSSSQVAIILLFIYSSYLFFQFFSHKSLYQDDSDEILESKKYRENPFKFKKFYHRKQPATSQCIEPPLVTSPPSSTQQHVLPSAAGDGTSHATQPTSDPESGDAVPLMQSNEETEEPQMNVPVSFGLLVVVTVLVAVASESLVDSINGLTDSGSIKHATAVTVSVKDKLTLSLGVAVGSSIQIALFVIPFMVILGWILDKPLTLLFDPLQSIVMFLSAIHNP
ncbi:hypothetical protein J3R83DRAFT_14083 [Lanmaoa asiatica]|nr:hypothetical protein J3R83DRAFT_14083 [Lanmaoa asiatica]